MKEKNSIADVTTLLQWLTESNADYVLVGGMAVGLWAENFLTAQEKSRFGTPIYSKDIDFRGERFLAAGIKNWFYEHNIKTSQLNIAMHKQAEKLGEIYSFPLEPANADADIGARANVEILQALPLLDSNITSKSGSKVVINNISVLDPFSLLICKLHGYHTRPPKESDNDFKHISILNRVIVNFSNSLNDKERRHFYRDAKGLKKVLDSGNFPLPKGSGFSTKEHAQFIKTLGYVLEKRAAKDEQQIINLQGKINKGPRL